MKKAQPPVEAVTETEAKAVEAAQPVEAAKPAEPTFTVMQLRPNVRVLFGISQSAYDGATHGVDPERKFTVDAMKKHIEKWMKEGY